MSESSEQDRSAVHRALISVSDKTGLEDLASGLHQAGVELVSTGSTAARIAAAGVPVTPVDEVTGFPECLDGRVKTLHPAVHAGILADRRLESHREQLTELGITAFDLVVVNLYPFAETVASGSDPHQCVEQVDIGGPAMVRSAAKNHTNVAVVVDPAGYDEVLAAVVAGGFTLRQRQQLAAAGFAHTAAYDTAVASWFATELAPEPDGWPLFVGAAVTRVAVLRYGENPHQPAAIYGHTQGSAGLVGLAGAEQLHGKAMSYNNYVDTEAALRSADDFRAPCVAVIKHANPCGIAIGVDAGPAADEDPAAAAHQRAHDCDPVSAFGGVIATNTTVTRAMAEQVAEVFTEVIAAPEFDDDALEILRRKQAIRILRVPDYGAGGLAARQICGGFLLQGADLVTEPGDAPEGWTLAAGSAADDETLRDLEFAWRAIRSVKSNAILLAHAGATVGIGMGQVNRVDSSRLAVSRAGARAAGAVAASDAFFPFADGLQVLLDAGIRAVVQPGGSKRDDECVAAASAAGVTMYLTGVRHFAH